MVHSQSTVHLGLFLSSSSKDGSSGGTRNQALCGSLFSNTRSTDRFWDQKPGTLCSSFVVPPGFGLDWDQLDVSKAQWTVGQRGQDVLEGRSSASCVTSVCSDFGSFLPGRCPTRQRRLCPSWTISKGDNWLLDVPPSPSGLCDRSMNKRRGTGWTPGAEDSEDEHVNAAAAGKQGANYTLAAN